MVKEFPLRPDLAKRLEGRHLQFSILEEEETGKRNVGWLEHVIDGWAVAYRIFVRASDGKVRVGEVRIFPAEHGKRDLGTWSGDGRKVPPRGVPSHVLKEVRVSEPLRELTDILGGNSQLVEHLGLPRRPRARLPSPTSARRRGGRRPLSDEHLARVAQAYVKGLGVRPRAPAQYVSEQLGKPVARVSDWVFKARQRGFLVSPGPGGSGRIGGELSPTAERILKQVALATRKRRAT